LGKHGALTLALLLAVSVPATQAADPTPGERVTGTVLLGTGIAAAAFLHPPREPAWRGGVAFDSLGESWRVQDPGRSRVHRRISDVGLWGLTAAAVGSSIDKGVTVGWRAAFAYGATVTAMGLTKTLTARERPYGSQCETGNELGMNCESLDRNASFFSGHAAVSAASAGLICLNYRSAVGAAGVACATGITVAGAVAILRVSGSMHWLTDVAVGAVVGVMTGYLLPKQIGETQREAARAALVSGSGSSARIIIPLGYLVF